jgi:hypothetical protein
MMLLPATSIQVLRQVVVPAGLYLPAKMRGDPGNVMLLAAGGQESGFKVREQYGDGPAHGLWQFEAGGGVKGVMTHPATEDVARSACMALGVMFDQAAIWRALATNDLLACLFARLLLWSSPRSLPAIGDQDGAYAYYADLWRPGKPDRSRWPAAYRAAVAAVRGG